MPQLIPAPLTVPVSFLPPTAPRQLLSPPFAFGTILHCRGTSARWDGRVVVWPSVTLQAQLGDFEYIFTGSVRLPKWWLIMHQLEHRIAPRRIVVEIHAEWVSGPPVALNGASPCVVLSRV